MSFGNYAELKLLDHLLGTTAYTMPTAYLSLHTGDPGETGANEAAGGSYIRKVAVFAAASGGSAANSGTISFTGMPAATITHIGLWDAVSSGNFLGGGALTGSQAFSSGDIARFTAGTVTVALD